MYHSVNFNPLSQFAHLGIMLEFSLGGTELECEQAYVLL